MMYTWFSPQRLCFSIHLSCQRAYNSGACFGVASRRSFAWRWPSSSRRPGQLRKLYHVKGTRLTHKVHRCINLLYLHSSMLLIGTSREASSFGAVASRRRGRTNPFEPRRAAVRDRFALRRVPKTRVYGAEQQVWTTGPLRTMSQTRQCVRSVQLRF